jgi:cytoskeletal protein CcmA (bactofilin family)
MANEFKVKNGLVVSGSTRITGSVTATSFTGSLAGTASYATYALNVNIDTSSLATTGSNTFKGAQTFQNNVTIQGTASIAYLNVTYESASIIYSTGSNQLGDATNDTQLLIGLIKMSGSAEITGSLKFPNGFGVTGSLFGTATTASYVVTAQTASYVLQAVSASYATSATSASYSLNATTASYIKTAQTASYFNTSTGLNQNVVINSGYYLQVGSDSKTFSGNVPSIDSVGSPWNIVSVNFSTYVHKSIFMRYVLDDALSPGTNMRAGTIMVVSDGTANINLTEVTTQDIGDTSAVDFTAAISGGSNIVRATVVSGTWNVYFDYTII